MSNKATLKHTVTQEEVEQYAGIELYFEVGQVIDVHVPIIGEVAARSTVEEGTATPDGYVGSTPGKGRG